MEAPLTERTGRFDPYVPRVASTWDAAASDSLWRPIHGSLAFVDISGFTNLSEKLARRGRIGAEELTSVLNRVFGHMLETVFERGGSLLKFGGDALLLLFDGEDHVMQACAATVEMRAALRQAAKEPTSVGRIALKMSSGIHTGPIDFFLVGQSHRELLVTGPTASTTTDMEGTADANEIVVSDAVKERVPKDFIGDKKGGGWLLRKQKINLPPRGPVNRDPIPDEEMARFVPKGLRSYLESGITDSEHRIATVGFVKFKGVDALLTEHGPERVGKELDDLVTTVQTTVDQEGITYLASDIDADGGKLILTAGIPSSRPDDEGRMLRAAKQILDTELGLKLRIGINRGHVFSGNVGTPFRRTYTVMGDTVNLAARLMAAAEPGMLYSSPGVLDLSSTLFRTEPLEPFYVKGKERPVQAYAVFEPTGVRPPDLKYELPFHGREAERDMIVQIITTCARSGRGGMMTITGDTGLGKTRLIAEVLEECPGLDTLLVQAEPTGADNPYWAFRDPLRMMLGIQRASRDRMAAELESVVAKSAPDLLWALPLLGDVMHIEVADNEQTSVIDPAFRPDRTAAAVIELLETIYTGPVAAVGEDGHWMDDASVALLERIGQAAKQHPWTVMFTARRERSDFEPLGDEIPLRPLDDEAVRFIIIESTAAAPLRPHDLNAIVERVGGNPMFLSAILDMVRETGSAADLPEDLDAVVSTEIDTLPPLTRQLLRYTSVLGRSFRRVVLDEYLAPEASQLDDATEEQLTRFLEADGSERMRFRHSVVHDVAYEGLSYNRRRQLHARAGEIIERLAGDDPDSVAEFLAHHYSQSGNHEKVWRFARVAAEKAMSTYTNNEAAAYFERALRAGKQLDTVSPTMIVELEEARGDALERAGLFDGSIRAYGEALRGSPDAAISANLRFKRARVKTFSGGYSAGLAELTRGTRLVEADERRSAKEAKARLLSFRAVIRIMQGRSDDALDLASEAEIEAMQSGEREALARSYMVLDAAHLTLGRKTETDYLPRALAIYEEIGDLLGASLVYNNMGERAWLEGRLDDAVELYRKADETSRRAGNDPDAANARANVGEVLVAQGRLEEARTTLEDAFRVLSAHQSHLALFAEIHLARVEMLEGRLEEAVRSLTRAVEDAKSAGQSEWALIARIYLASAHRAAGRADRSLELLDEAESDISQAGDLYGPLLSLERASALREVGDLDLALETALAGKSAAAELMLLREEREIQQLIDELAVSAAPA